MLLSATKSRKKQQAEAVQSVIHAEAEKRRKERENFHITSVPVLVRAAHEPSLYKESSEDHEEGSTSNFGLLTNAHCSKNLDFSQYYKFPISRLEIEFPAILQHCLQPKFQLLTRSKSAENSKLIVSKDNLFR